MTEPTEPTERRHPVAPCAICGNDDLSCDHRCADCKAVSSRCCASYLCRVCCARNCKGHEADGYHFNLQACAACNRLCHHSDVDDGGMCVRCREESTRKANAPAAPTPAGKTKGRRRLGAPAATSARDDIDTHPLRRDCYSDREIKAVLRCRDGYTHADVAVLADMLKQLMQRRNEYESALGRIAASPLRHEFAARRVCEIACDALGDAAPEG